MPSGARIFDVYSSEHLRARAVVGMSADSCVVTFDSYHENLSLGRPGFEQGFLRKSRMDAVHVVSAGNTGYQYADLPELCSKVSELTKAYRRVVAYGSSMGADAAIRYGGWAGAHVALAISPQFTLDPRRRPFDKRWVNDLNGVRFIHEERRDAVRQAVVIYDSESKIDSAHVALLHGLTTVDAIPLPDSGHPSAGFLNDLGLFHQIVLDVCAGEFDPKKLMTEAGRRCQESAQFRHTRALRPRNLRSRYRLLVEAARLGPTHAPTLQDLAKTAIKVGLPQVALEALGKVDDTPAALHLRSLAYAKTGQLPRAIEILESLCQAHPGWSICSTDLRRLKRWQWLEGPRSWLRHARSLMTGSANRQNP